MSSVLLAVHKAVLQGHPYVAQLLLTFNPTKFFSGSDSFLGNGNNRYGVKSPIQIRGEMRNTYDELKELISSKAPVAFVPSGLKLLQEYAYYNITAQNIYVYTNPAKLEMLVIKPKEPRYYLKFVLEETSDDDHYRSYQVTAKLNHAETQNQNTEAAESVVELVRGQLSGLKNSHAWHSLLQIVTSPSRRPKRPPIIRHIWSEPDVYDGKPHNPMARDEAPIGFNRRLGTYAIKNDNEAVGGAAAPKTDKSVKPRTEVRIEGPSHHRNLRRDKKLSSRAQIDKLQKNFNVNSKAVGTEFAEIILKCRLLDLLDTVPAMSEMENVDELLFDFVAEYYYQPANRSAHADVTEKFLHMLTGMGLDEKMCDHILMTVVFLAAKHNNLTNVLIDFAERLMTNKPLPIDAIAFLHQEFKLSVKEATLAIDTMRLAVSNPTHRAA